VRSPGASRWLILALFVVLGVGLTAWEPTRELAIGPIWLVASLSVAFLCALLIARARRLDRLRETGEAGVARATRVHELGFAVHEMPRVELDLQVQAPAGGYALTKRIVVPLAALPDLRAGEQFAVRIDPGDRERLVFDWAGEGGPRASWIARALGGPATIDASALAREAEHIAQPGGTGP
jgi:hypothetical protein